MANNEIKTINLINIDDRFGRMSPEKQVAEKVNEIISRINQLIYSENARAIKVSRKLRQTKATAPKPVNPDNLPEDPDTGYLIDIFCSDCGENISYERDLGLYECTNCGQRYDLKELPRAS